MNCQKPTDTQRLLAVDDDPFYRHLYGHFARTALSGMTTVESAKHVSDQALRDADVLILDLDMPDTDGMHFLTTRLPDNMAHNPELHLIICSGMDQRVMELARRAAKLIGLKYVDMLQKPFTAADLRDTLKQAPLQPTARPKGPHLEKATILELEKALKAGDLRPYWQPQISTLTGQLSGFEILSRWHHPTQGVLMPGHFIDAMESDELGSQYALTLLRQALTSIRHWSTEIKFTGSISLNVPPIAIMHPEFYEQLITLLREYEFTEHRLVLEVTESTAAKNDSELLAGLARIMMHKIQLAIDDFGTGHSSLDRLGTEAFSEIKIDRSFVGVLEVSDMARAITSSIIQTAKAAGLRIVAEGVSNRQSVEVMTEMGCTHLQGSYFAMPLAEADIPRWFKETAGYFPEARYIPPKTA